MGFFYPGVVILPGWTPRHDLGVTRVRNILREHVVASARTLEQKISDAGPNDQRIDPHVLTEVRKALTLKGEIRQLQRGRIPWFHLSNADATQVQTRLLELGALHQQTQDANFVMQLGQALEIATFRALHSQSALAFFGNFPDLDAHDDSTLYSKEEPPSSLSGNQIPSGKKLDFLVHGKGVYAGLEVKNIREWFYPNRPAVREMLFKCCSLDVVRCL